MSLLMTPFEHIHDTAVSTGWREPAYTCSRKLLQPASPPPPIAYTKHTRTPSHARTSTLKHSGSLRSYTCVAWPCFAETRVTLASCTGARCGCGQGAEALALEEGAQAHRQPEEAQERAPRDAPKLHGKRRDRRCRESTCAADRGVRCRASGAALSAPPPVAPHHTFVHTTHAAHTRVTPRTLRTARIDGTNGRVDGRKSTIWERGCLQNKTEQTTISLQ